MAFNVGDVVKLKSGGEEMTIMAFDERRMLYECSWMSSRKVLKTHKVPEAALVLAPKRASKDL
jgi:uncharacterized protein YodC (DUF2158 family)